MRRSRPVNSEKGDLHCLIDIAIEAYRKQDKRSALIAINLAFRRLASARATQACRANSLTGGRPEQPFKYLPFRRE
jgi:hypothetical protein